MADGKKKVVAKGKVYKGSKQNGGREIVVYHVKKNGKWTTTSQNAARAEVEKTRGKLSKDEHVDHVDNNKHNNSKKNLRVISAKENIGKENKRRAGKKKK